MKKYHIFTVLKWVVGVGFICALPFGYNELKVISFTEFQPSTWFFISYILIAATVLTYLLNAKALQLTSVTVVSSSIYIQPLLAGIIAVCAGVDTFSQDKLIAGMFILVGLYMTSSKQRSKENIYSDVTSNRLLLN